MQKKFSWIFALILAAIVTMLVLVAGELIGQYRKRNTAA
jgi:hypothetical protein